MFRFLLTLVLISLTYAFPGYAMGSEEDLNQSYFTPHRDPLVKVLEHQVRSGERRYKELLSLTKKLAEELELERAKNARSLLPSSPFVESEDHDEDIHSHVLGPVRTPKMNSRHQPCHAKTSKRGGVQMQRKKLSVSLKREVRTLNQQLRKLETERQNPQPKAGVSLRERETLLVEALEFLKNGR